jgi:hypothetical protein
LGHVVSFEFANAEAIGHADLIDIYTELRELSVSVRMSLLPRTDRYLAETAAYLILVKLQPTTEHYPSERDSSLYIRYQQREFLVDLPSELSSSVPRHTMIPPALPKSVCYPQKTRFFLIGTRN